MDILIGTSGFSFDDWKGTVYPLDIKKQDMLSFYENELGFNILEINYTYYSLPSQKAVEGLVRKTTDSFQFVVKAYKQMTHQIYDKEKNKIIDRIDVFNKFKHSLEPLISAEKLKCVLAQFPYSFYPNERNLNYLKSFKELMGSIPVVIEFRNIIWHRERFTNFLRTNKLGYCVVDEPKISGLMPFKPQNTTNIGYFRFHGRNQDWFNVSRSERYDYLYAEKELNDFIKPVYELAKRTHFTLVFFNNCHAGSAAKNASTFIKLLNSFCNY